MNILRLKKAAFLSVFLAMTFIRTAVAQDFNFTLQPSTLTLVPGQQASFVVSMAPIAGFTNQVTLSTTNLPSGVTASFSPSTLTPPGTSILTLTATTNADTGNFTLDITAVGGGITHVTSSKVSVSFGLLPICYGAFQGRITDVTTGLPITNASVNANGYYSAVDSNGVFILTNLPLAGLENLPQYYGVQAFASGYYNEIVYSYAVCDATNTVTFAMTPLETATISGMVVSDTGVPLTNAPMQASAFGTIYGATDSNGMYLFKSLQLGADNASVNYNVQAQPPGYWYSSSNTLVQGNSNSVINFVCTEACLQTVYGSVVYSNTALPASNVQVSINAIIPNTGYYSTLYAFTDANGNYSISNVTLGYLNVPRTASVAAYASGYYQSYTNISVSDCPVAGALPGTPGGAIDAGTIVLNPIPPPPSNNIGTLTGYVYDIDTGDPLPFANMQINGIYYFQADTNGFYEITNLVVGTGATTNSVVFVYASESGYFQSYSNVTVYANETTNLNIYLLKAGFGGIEGTISDAVTGLPVTGAYESLGNQVTKADGYYFTGPLQLYQGNVPTFESFSVSKNGYWSTFTNTTITNGITNVLNIQLIPVCTGATIVGNVINALTQTPITNATVSTYSGGSYTNVMTDTNGDFILVNITVGNDNSPVQSTLTASAPGFNPQSKTVTIFCNAAISTTFGVPETNFGSIQGFVTNVLTGQAISNVFIGSSFGGATTTDTNGYYILNQVPLSANGSNRTWTVTAIPNNFPAQTKPVLVSANATNELDFGFGQPLTELVISATGTPNPVNVGSNVTYSITLTNYKADATNVVLIDTLPLGVTFVSASVTNNPGGFGIPVESNGIVTLTGSDLGSNAGVVLLITVTPTTAGGLTNVTTVTSDTPDISPNSTNHTAIVLGTAQEPAPLFADVGVSMTGTPNPVLASNQLTYQLVVDNNFGPDTAPSVIVTDSLPANVTFGSASVSQGSFSLVSNSVLWNVGSLAHGASASATIVVLPLQVGQVVNNASVGLAPTTPPVRDDDPDNDTVQVTTTVTTPTITTGTIQYSDISFNAQTGLFQQQVTYVNQPPQEAQKLGEGPPPPVANAVRLFVLGLPSSIQLYNATGTSNGIPYVEYDNTVPSGGSVQFGLEYYEGSRQPFVSTNFMAVAVVAVIVPPTTGTYLQLDRSSFDYDGELTIEFATVPGHTYEIQYSDDMQTWAAAIPQIVARNTRTEWTDVGPPVTTTYGSLGGRFYRIVEIK